jgi:two-component system chemotaxis response regulator CheB
MRRIVVIGASSGGLDAVRSILEKLPPDFPASICVVIHMYAQSPPDVLPSVLKRSTTLRVVTGTEGAPLKKGSVYVAPPDQHMLVEEGVLRLSRGPKENRFRPAIDPLFRSAAQAYGANAIGVVLSGNLDDGTSGLAAIKQAGGTAVVQDPADASYPSMPESAARHVKVDYSVPLARLPALLTKLASAPSAREGNIRVSPATEIEINIAKEQNAMAITSIAEPSPFACPECHGVLLRMKDVDPVRFRCHTGHAYSAESLLAALSETIEQNLWTAVRALQEGELLLTHLADNMKNFAASGVAHLKSQASAAHRDAALVKNVVTNRRALRIREE